MSKQWPTVAHLLSWWIAEKVSRYYGDFISGQNSIVDATPDGNEVETWVNEFYQLAPFAVHTALMENNEFAKKFHNPYYQPVNTA